MKCHSYFAIELSPPSSCVPFLTLTGTAYAKPKRSMVMPTKLSKCISGLIGDGVRSTPTAEENFANSCVANVAI